MRYGAGKPPKKTPSSDRTAGFSVIFIKNLKKIKKSDIKWLQVEKKSVIMLL
jgi:hypothetical protein